MPRLGSRRGYREAVRSGRHRGGDRKRHPVSGTNPAQDTRCPEGGGRGGPFRFPSRDEEGNRSALGRTAGDDPGDPGSGSVPPAREDLPRPSGDGDGECLSPGPGGEEHAPRLHRRTSGAHGVGRLDLPLPVRALRRGGCGHADRGRAPPRHREGDGALLRGGVRLHGRGPAARPYLHGIRVDLRGVRAGKGFPPREGDAPQTHDPFPPRGTRVRFAEAAQDPRGDPPPLRREHGLEGQCVSRGGTGPPGRDGLDGLSADVRAVPVRGEEKV